MRKLSNFLPVLIVLAIIIALGYPLALIFGLPLAKRDMNDLRKWQKETISSPAPNNIFGESEFIPSPGSDIPYVYKYSFDNPAKTPILVKNNKPVDFDYGFKDGQIVISVDKKDKDNLVDSLVTWSKELTKVSDNIYSFDEKISEQAYQRAIYIANKLAKEGVVLADKPTDGARAEFSFKDATGPILLDNQILVEGQDYQINDGQVSFKQAPGFGTKLRRISADYGVLDAAKGLIVFSNTPTDSVRATKSVIRLAEQLQVVDPQKQIYAFNQPKIVEFDKNRRIFAGSTELSNDALRPKERIDGKTAEFSFKKDSGIIVLDGVLQTQGKDYQRQGNKIIFPKNLVRNAKLRLYPDYYLINPEQSQIMLANKTTEPIWTNKYSYFSQPACGTTVMECFFALPQHPVPFPHWIVKRIRPFFAKFPFSDQRNIIRAIIYSTLGTLSALALGGLIGIILAILFVLFRPLERALLPWTIASQTIPIIALVPVLLLVLGNFGITIQTSLLPTAIIGAYICFFPIVVSTVKGLRAVDPLTLDLMKSYAASPLEVFMKVRFPAAVPFFFTGIKLGAAAALLGALVAETESNNSRGLGFQILGQVQSGNVADVWILLIISGLLGIGLVAFVNLLQRIFAPWEQL